MHCEFCDMGNKQIFKNGGFWIEKCDAGHIVERLVEEERVWLCGKCEQYKGKYPAGEKLEGHTRHCPLFYSEKPDEVVTILWLYEGGGET